MATITELGDHLEFELEPTLVGPPPFQQPPVAAKPTHHCYICGGRWPGSEHTRPTKNGPAYYYIGICSGCRDQFIPGNLGN